MILPRIPILITPLNASTARPATCASNREYACAALSLKAIGKSLGEIWDGFSFGVHELKQKKLSYCIVDGRNLN